MTKRAIREAVRALGAPMPEGLGGFVTAKGRPDYTARNRAMLDAGRHPATGTKVRPDLGTCGGCAHHVTQGYTGRIFHKCEFHRLGASRSEASDIRVSWPACEGFKASVLDETQD